MAVDWQAAMWDCVSTAVKGAVAGAVSGAVGGVVREVVQIRTGSHYGGNAAGALICCVGFWKGCYSSFIWPKHSD